MIKKKFFFFTQYYSISLFTLFVHPKLLFTLTRNIIYYNDFSWLFKICEKRKKNEHKQILAGLKIHQKIIIITQIAREILYQSSRILVLLIDFFSFFFHNFSINFLYAFFRLWYNIFLQKKWMRCGVVCLNWSFTLLIESI